jgi:hypothetical protein
MLFLIIIFKEQAPYSLGAIYPLSKKKTCGCNFWVIESVQWVKNISGYECGGTLESVVSIDAAMAPRVHS